MRQALAISERRAWRLVGLSKTTLRRVVEEEPRTIALKARIIDLAHARRRFGYRAFTTCCAVRLTTSAFTGSTAKLRSACANAGVAARHDRSAGVAPADGANEILSMDFVMDSLANGRRLKCLMIVDDFTRECPDVAVDHGIGGSYVARVLDAISQFRGATEKGELNVCRDSRIAHKRT